jgi:phage shock protein PspC (stress-responsive transcriptional regulator)
MNKTVSIHIQGFAFLLEEQAYDMLRNYLSKLASVLQNEQGKEEILQDIELRIVELLQEKIGAQQVVQLDLLQEIIDVLGSPEAFGEDNSRSDETFAFDGTTSATAEKRFFRDPNSALLGGVASGVAAYFNVDVVFIRVAFVLFTMVFGSGIPIYILLWIIIPSAKTASEKLQMKGVPVNIESIKTEFKEATERVEKNAKKWSNQFKTGTGLSESARRFLQLLKKAIGLVLVLWGLVLLIGLSVFIFIDPQLVPAQINGEFTSLGELSALFFEKGQNELLYIGVGLIGYAISLSSMLTGFRLLFTFEAKWLRAGYFGLGFASICGFIFLTYVGISTAQGFTIEGELSKEIGTYSGDSLRLDILPELHIEGYRSHRNSTYNFGFRSQQQDGYDRIMAQDGRIFISGIAINYVEATDSLYHVKIWKKAHGRSFLKANRRASHIDFPCALQKNTIQFASGFSYPAKDRMRDQEVELQIAVPKGKKVFSNGTVVYPFAFVETPERSSDRAYVSGNGEYSAW